MSDDRPATEPIVTPRLDLTPLMPDDADEMVEVLAGDELYAFIGGSPPTLEALRAQYEHQAVGHSADGTETWLNWIIRPRPEGRAVGFVQATITRRRPSRGDRLGRRAPVAATRLRDGSVGGARGLARRPWRGRRHGQRPPGPRRVGVGRPAHRPPARPTRWSTASGPGSEATPDARPLQRIDPLTGGRYLYRVG